MIFFRQWFWLFPLLLLPALAWFVPNIDAQGAGDALKYLGIAWDMHQHHHYMLSLVNGVLYSDKPPLLFWLIIASWHVFGDNSMLGPQCLISAIIIAWILLSRATYAVIFPHDSIGKTLLPYVMLGSYAVLDCLGMLRVDLLLIVAVLLVNLGILMLVSSQQKQIWRSLAYIVVGTFLGLFAKGPVIYLFTLLPYLISVMLWKNYRAHWKIILGAMVVSSGGFLLAWALPVALHAGDEYSKQIFFKQIAHRAVSAHNNYFIYLYNNLPLLLLPWITNIVFFKKIKEAFLEIHKNAAFVWIILAVVLVVFSLFSQKSVRYLLPWVSYGFIFWARFFVLNQHNIKIDWFNRIVLAIIFILATLLSMSLLFPGAQAVFIQGSNGHFVISKVALISFGALNLLLVIYLFTVRKGVLHLVAVASMALTLFCSVFSLYGVVVARQFTHMNQVKNYLSQPQHYDGEIALYHVVYYDGLFNYAARAEKPFPVLKTQQSLKDWLQKNPKGLVITTGSCPNQLQLVMFYQERVKRPKYSFCQQ